MAYMYIQHYHCWHNLLQLKRPLSCPLVWVVAEVFHLHFHSNSHHYSQGPEAGHEVDLKKHNELAYVIWTALNLYYSWIDKNHKYDHNHIQQHIIVHIFYCICFQKQYCRPWICSLTFLVGSSVQRLLDFQQPDVDDNKKVVDFVACMQSVVLMVAHQVVVGGMGSSAVC